MVMTMEKKEAITDTVDQALRSGDVWWTALLKTGKISIPNAIMLGIVYGLLTNQINAMKGATTDRWTRTDMKALVQTCREENGWNVEAKDWNWRCPDPDAVHAAAIKNQDQP